MNLAIHAGAVGAAVLLASCDAAPPSPPIDPNRVGLVAYAGDGNLTRLNPASASPGAIYDALDPTPPKQSDFVKSEYETQEAAELRLSKLTGEANRYVLVLPALLQYDADGNEASFCPVWTMANNPQCLPGQRDRTKVDIDSMAAGNFTFLSELDVEANNLREPLFPISFPAAADVAQKVDAAGTARVAIVFSLDRAYGNGRFSQTSGTTYDQIKRTRVTIRRVVAYQQDGVVLGAREFE